MNYRDEIMAHHYAGRSFDGTSQTVAEIALYLLDKAVSDLRTMDAWKDKSDDEIVRRDLLSRFMHNLGNSPYMGVTIPINGPAMRLRTEHFGSYSMNGIFWLSGFRKGVYETREDMGCGEGTLDQLHARVEERLTVLRSQQQYQGMPSFQDLDMRSGPADKPDAWYPVTIRRPDGRIFKLEEVIWPHANESALEIASEKILLTTACLHMHGDRMDDRLNKVALSISQIMGDIPVHEVEQIDFQGGAGAPPYDSRQVTYRVTFEAKDEFLQKHQARCNVVVTDNGTADPYDSLRKIAVSQTRRLKRAEILVSRPALITALHKNDTDLLLEHFSTRREYNSPEHTYTLSDGVVELRSFLDEGHKVRYEQGVIRLFGMELPDSTIQGIKGRRVCDVIQHPALDGCTIKKARRLKDHIAIYADVPMLSKAECEAEMASQMGLAG